MTEGIPYANIVILALLAGLILLRLRSVLGSRDENTSDFTSRPAAYTSAVEQEPIVQLDDKSLRKPAEDDSYTTRLPDGDVLRVVNDIKARDPQFSATDFLRGARGAFEMVFDAFAKGDRATLKRLLADSIYQHFAAEIDAREKGDNRTETTLISTDPKEIMQASLTRNVARLIVRFASEQVTVTRSSVGDIVGGNASDIQNVEDHWVFERDITSKNPNWKIVET